MSNSLRLTKKAFTIAIATATILWTAGLAAFVPTQAQAAEYGDLIVGETLSTVYYYGSDGLRYSFPTEKTYFSWYVDFDDVVQISDEELADISPAGNIVYRPGSRWLKITSDEKVYAVSTDGTLHWIETAEVAEDLAGSNWNQFIDDVPDVYFTNYTVGESITDASEGYNGMLWTDGDDTYLVWDGEVRSVSSAGMSANGFQDGFVLDGDGFDVDSLDEGDDVTGELAYLTDAAQEVEDEDYEETKEIEVSISGSPASSTLIETQAVADLLHVTLTNNSASDVKLTGLTVTRTGVSSDTTLSNVYLFDGFVRLTDAATISSGRATFNDSTGLLTIAAGASETIYVRSDIANTTNGQTVGLKIASASDLVFSVSGSASGSFPMQGATHTIADNPTTFGTADFTGSTTPTAATVDPQEGYRVFERTLSVGKNELNLTAARFRNIGSIDADDVNNWQLYVGGVMRGSAVSQEDADGYVTFDFSSAPIELKTGNHQIKVMADIIGGSGRTVTVGLRNSADFILVDQDYSQPVRPTVGSATFAAMDAGAQLISSGTLTYTKMSDSPSGNVTNTASGVTLGKWSVKAFGESMKVENLRFAFTESDADDVSLRNGAVYLNGSQIGSTASLEANAGAGTDYTEYTFGSAFIVVPGSPATLEIRADIYDADGTDNIEANDTIIAQVVDMNGILNVQQMTSGGYIDAPDGSAVAANTLTVSTGSLTLAKNGSYANQTVIDPKTAYKVGSATVTASTTEAINLTEIAVDFDEDGTGHVADSDTSEPADGDMYNLYVKYGPAANMVTTSTKGTISETSNSWSINYALGAGETIYVDVYADIDSAISTGEVIQTAIDVNGTTVNSGTSPSTTKIAGQTITITAGSFTEFNDNHPVAAVAAANQLLEVARYRFSASNENYTIKELTTSVASATAAGLVNEVRIYDGSTLVASTVYDENTNTRATFTGLAVAVNANVSKTLIIKYLLNNVGVGAGTSQTDVANTLYSVKFADSQGTETTETSGTAFSSVNGNIQYVFASVPTITAVDLTNSTLVNGQAVDLYKFTVSAASNGNVALKQFKLSTSWSDGGTADTLEVESLKLYKNGSDITSSVTIVDENGNVVTSTSGLLESDEDAVITWTTEDTVSAGETVTYTVRGTPSGFRTVGADTSGDSVSFYLAQDAATNGTSVYLNDETDLAGGQSEIMELFTSAAASSSDGTGTAADDSSATVSANRFIWSDVSAASHSSSANADSTGDWHNGYLVKNLDLSGETWSK
jgi:hypothetical protein